MSLHTKCNASPKVGSVHAIAHCLEACIYCTVLYESLRLHHPKLFLIFILFVPVRQHNKNDWDRVYSLRRKASNG